MSSFAENPPIVPSLSHPISNDSASGAVAADVSLNICVDTLGGDDAPVVVLDALRLLLASEAAFDQRIRFTLTGYAQDIQPLADAHPRRVVAVPTTEVIGMAEQPVAAVRQKRDSSIVVACRLVSEDRSDAFFTAGSTGAAMTAATLLIGRVRGVKRPAIATVIPSPQGQLTLLDVGANSDAEPEYLLQFAKMGSIYAEQVLRIAAPRVGLLNVGSEPSKGSRVVKEAYSLLASEVRGFCGNAEGSDIFQGSFDVIVSDGFTGNVVLKAMEGTVSVLFKELKRLFLASPRTKLAAALARRDLQALKDELDVDAIGGAPLLGLRKTVVIGHGSANATAIANGIRQAARAVRCHLPQLIADSLTADVNA